MSDETAPSGLTTPPETTTPSPTPTTEAPVPATPEVKPEAQPEAKPLAVGDFKLPEGFTLDEKQGGDFVALLNDASLSRAELAQKLIDQYAGIMQGASEKGTTEFMNLQAQWRETIEKDSEIGGAKLPETTSAIGRVMEQYGSAEAREAFDVTGAGNNPHIVRMLAKMAADLNEPGPLDPPSPSAQSIPLEDRLYTKGK